MGVDDDVEQVGVLVGRGMGKGVVYVIFLFGLFCVQFEKIFGLLVICWLVMGMRFIVREIIW